MIVAVAISGGAHPDWFALTIGAIRTLMWLAGFIAVARSNRYGSFLAAKVHLKQLILCAFAVATIVSGIGAVFNAGVIALDLGAVQVYVAFTLLVPFCFTLAVTVAPNRPPEEDGL